MKLKLLIIAALLIQFSPRLQAQSLEDEVRAMRAELQKLRQEVAELRQQVQATETFPLVEAQVQEQAQTKVESASRFPMKIFGAIVSNTAWNSGNPNWLDIPNIAGPVAPGGNGSFTSTMRQSRIGATVQGPPMTLLRLALLSSLLATTAPAVEIHLRDTTFSLSDGWSIEPAALPPLVERLRRSSAPYAKNSR